MIEDRVMDIPQLLPEENGILAANFTHEEVYEAISHMEHNKTLGLDGFLAEFHQHFWDVIKIDLMAMFGQLQEGELPLYQLKGLLHYCLKRRMLYKYNNVDQFSSLTRVSKSSPNSPLFVFSI
jgi:hypothetical protein